MGLYRGYLVCMISGAKGLHKAQIVYMIDDLGTDKTMETATSFGALAALKELA